MADDYRDALNEFADLASAPDLACIPFDAAAAFDRLPAQGAPFSCQIADTFFAGHRIERYREVSNPGLNRSDNHLQGIQRFRDRVYLSAGDLMEGRPHLFVLRYQPSGPGTEPIAQLSRIISLDDQRDHAGGMQRLGNVLVISIEGSNVGSMVGFLLLEDPDRPKWIHGARIDRAEKKASAAAIAMLPLPAGPRILVGVTWVQAGKLFGLMKGKAFLDLYLSRDADLRNGFLPEVVRVDVSRLGDRVPPWQSIAFFPPATSDEVMLLGTRSTKSAPGGTHKADLCRLRFDGDAAAQWPVVVTAEPIKTRTFQFDPDFGDFAAAAGVECEATGDFSLLVGGHFRFSDGFKLSVCSSAPII